MGMYTEIHVAGSCNEKHRAVPVLLFLFGEGQEPEPATLPDHAYFQCPRWGSIGNCTSYYLSPLLLREAEVRHGDLYFHSVSNLKNYDGEIELFFDWLKSEGIEHYGHSRYECQDESPVKLYRFDVDEEAEVA